MFRSCCGLVFQCIFDNEYPALESLNDLVGSITHIAIKERVPDSVFDHANQVEVIDIEPEDLIDRMKEGKFISPSRQNKRFKIFSARKSSLLCR